MSASASLRGLERPRAESTAGGRMPAAARTPAPSASAAAPAHGPLLTPVLVLNASYEPINVCAARRAVVMVMKGVARTEEVHNQHLRSSRVELPLPSVIRLLHYRRIPHRTRALSRKNILMRDRNTCQYCGATLAAPALTLDHVVPRSRGGKSSWDNLVTSCHPCNHRKGDRLPAEAEMQLLRDPRPFNLHTNRHLIRMMGRSDEKWRKYLFF